MNPYRHNPLRACWERGRKAAVNGEPCDPPYRQSLQHHGGTWGYQANRAWEQGWQYERGRLAV